MYRLTSRGKALRKALIRQEIKGISWKGRVETPREDLGYLFSWFDADGEMSDLGKYVLWGNNYEMESKGLGNSLKELVGLSKIGEALQSLEDQGYIEDTEGGYNE